MRLLARLCVILATLAVASGCGSALPSPGGACESPTFTPVVDEEHGFSICLPGHWRDLRAGDPAWVEIYGEELSETEQRVESGTITRFAVPLRPRDADTAVNLTIYARGNANGVSSAEAGDAYMDVGREADATGMELGMVGLPVGDVAEVTGTIPNTISDVPSVDFFDAFVVAVPDASFYLVFRCTLTSRGAFEEQFQQLASTFKLVPKSSRRMLDPPP